MSTTPSLEDLSRIHRGDVIGPDDPGYEEARRVFNGAIDRRPAAVARSANVADVISAIGFARERALPVAVRGGGHNVAGSGTCDDGIVIDLAGMKGVRVDAESRTVRVGPGCVQADVDHATHAFGLAVPSGVVGSTGIAGLALGGGHGYLSRKHGLTADNLLAADVVLADGRLVTASETQHPDLFWALRGGGGNFGVVTSFLFRAHPVRTVWAGPVFWDAEHGREVMRWYREFLPSAPEDLYAFLSLQRVPPVPAVPEELHGRNVCALIWCHDGPADEARAAMAPMGDLPPPLFEHVGEMAFPALQGMSDPLLPKGLHWYWRGDLFRDLTDEAIEVHLAHTGELPSALSSMHLYPVDGAVQRVPPEATAWFHRDAAWSMVIGGVVEEGDGYEAMADWVRGYWEELHPHSVGAAYVNFLMEEGEDRVRAAYGANYERLAAVKARYDPDNFFRVNQNVRPARG